MSQKSKQNAKNICIQLTTASPYLQYTSDVQATLTGTKEKEEIQSVLSELKNSENEILLKKSAVSERLSVEFKIPSEELEALKPTVSIDLIDLKMKVESHKQRLDQFGEINPLALEAYQEISQRFDFISSQKNDLCTTSWDGITA